MALDQSHRAGQLHAPFFGARRFLRARTVRVRVCVRSFISFLAVLFRVPCSVFLLSPRIQPSCVAASLVLVLSICRESVPAWLRFVAGGGR